MMTSRALEMALNVDMNHDPPYYFVRLSVNPLSLGQPFSPRCASSIYIRTVQPFSCTRGPQLAPLGRRLQMREQKCETSRTDGGVPLRKTAGDFISTISSGPPVMDKPCLTPHLSLMVGKGKKKDGDLPSSSPYHCAERLSR
jgi:hypothetical protein